MNQQLLDYINQQVTAGVAPEEIKKVLLAQGWVTQDVDSTFISLGIHTPVIAPIPPHVPQPPQMQSTAPLVTMPIAPYTPQSITQIIPQTEFIYAGFWRRFSALFLDALFLLAVASTLNLVSLFMGVPLVKLPLFNLIYFILCFLYNPLLESSSWQGSIGKKLTGLSVTDEVGQRISFLRALGRHLSKILSTIFLIGFIMVGFTAKKQGLHDMIAGCLVVKNKPEVAGWIRVIILVVELALIGLAFVGAMFSAHTNFQVMTGDGSIQSQSPSVSLDSKEFDKMTVLSEFTNPTNGFLQAYYKEHKIYPATLADAISDLKYPPSGLDINGYFYMTKSNGASYVMAVQFSRSHTFGLPKLYPEITGTYFGKVCWQDNFYCFGPPQAQ